MSYCTDAVVAQVLIHLRMSHFFCEWATVSLHGSQWLYRRAAHTNRLTQRVMSRMNMSFPGWLQKQHFCCKTLPNLFSTARLTLKSRFIPSTSQWLVCFDWPTQTWSSIKLRIFEVNLWTVNDQFEPRQTPFSMHNSSYRTLQDNEEKYICEVPVDPIFMQHTDKIVVKVLKNTVNINSHGLWI